MQHWWLEGKSASQGFKIVPVHAAEKRRGVFQSILSIGVDAYNLQCRWGHRGQGGHRGHNNVVEESMDKWKNEQVEWMNVHGERGWDSFDLAISLWEINNDIHTSQVAERTW